MGNVKHMEENVLYRHSIFSRIKLVSHQLVVVEKMNCVAYQWQHQLKGQNLDHQRRIVHIPASANQEEEFVKREDQPEIELEYAVVAKNVSKRGNNAFLDYL